MLETLLDKVYNLSARKINGVDYIPGGNLCE